MPTSEYIANILIKPHRDMRIQSFYILAKLRINKCRLVSYKSYDYHFFAMRLKLFDEPISIYCD